MSSALTNQRSMARNDEDDNCSRLHGSDAVRKSVSVGFLNGLERAGKA